MSVHPPIPITSVPASPGSTLSGRLYLGPCWEYLQQADGFVKLTKVYVYLVSGERRFALTEQDAREAVRS